MLFFSFSTFPIRYQNIYCSSTLRGLIKLGSGTGTIRENRMKELAYSYIEFGEEYWWAFLIIWLLWIIVAHIPNFIDFHYADIIIPIILLAIWGILKLFVVFSMI